jgi:hypothetical protein
MERDAWRTAPLVLVPPLSLGATYLSSAMIISLICLLSVLAFSILALRRGFHSLTPAIYCLLSLTAVVWGLYAWTALS